MTQGAIDLVQAQLKPPPFPSLRLLRDAPCPLPEVISTDKITRPPQHKAILKYRWQDEGAFIGITIPKYAIPPASDSSVQQFQCSIGSSHLQCTFQERGVDGLVTQHVFRIAHLHAPVQPEQSVCDFRGQPVQLTVDSSGIGHGSAVLDDSLQPIHKAHDDNSTIKITAQPCKYTAKIDHDGTQNVPPQQTNLRCAKQADPHSQQLQQQQQSCDLAIAQPCKQAGSAAITVKLCKPDSDHHWDKLKGEAPVMVPVKQPPASPAAMAALRRTLMQQRQQRAQAAKHCSVALSTLPATNSDASATQGGSSDATVGVSALPLALSGLTAPHRAASAKQEASSDANADATSLPAALSNLHSSASTKQQGNASVTVDVAALPAALLSQDDLAELAVCADCEHSTARVSEHELAQIKVHLQQHATLFILLQLKMCMVPTCLLPRASHKQVCGSVFGAAVDYCHRCTSSLCPLDATTGVLKMQIAVHQKVMCHTACRNPEAKQRPTSNLEHLQRPLLNMNCCCKTAT